MDRPTIENEIRYLQNILDTMGVAMSSWEIRDLREKIAKLRKKQEESE